MNEKTNSTESAPNVGTISNCMYKLWEASADNLTNDELKWFASLSEGLETRVECLAEVTEGIACMVTDDHTGSFKDGRQLSTLLFNISNQLETIAGLVHVSGGAYDRLARPEIYENWKKMQAAKPKT